MTIDELLNLYFEFEDEKGDGKATIEAFLNPPSKEIQAKMKQVYIEYLQVFNDENY